MTPVAGPVQVHKNPGFPASNRGLEEVNKNPVQALAPSFVTFRHLAIKGVVSSSLQWHPELREPWLRLGRLFVL